MSRPRSNSGQVERTMTVNAPDFHRSGKIWRDYRFGGLEKVSSRQVKLGRQLEWLIPGLASATGSTEAVTARLSKLFEEPVSLRLEYLKVLEPGGLKKLLSEPTCLAVLAPLPHKARGLLEIELPLAHAAIDLLLGGAGETVGLRALSDIEEGVMSYLILEMLKALGPQLSDGLPRLRLLDLVKGVDQALSIVTHEEHLGLVQFRCTLGTHEGYLRLLVPCSVLAELSAPGDSAGARQRRAAQARANLGRIAGASTVLRVEIGRGELSSGDLNALGPGDVVLLEELSVRSDQGEGGTGFLKLGSGLGRRLDAEIYLEEGTYRAKVTGLSSAHLQGKSVDQSDQKAEGSELLGEIPLQIAVELARIPVTAEQVVGLKVGEVLELGRGPGEPVDLSVNNRLIGRGELVEVEGQLGVRVTSLAG